MKIEIKKSQKPVKYEDALRIMEKRLLDINQNKCLLVGTWSDAKWAIRFYEKFGFILHEKKESNSLLEKYWNIQPKQIENSVVLEKIRI